MVGFEPTSSYSCFSSLYWLHFWSDVRESNPPILTGNQEHYHYANAACLERKTRLELAMGFLPSDWKSGALPLGYFRIFGMLRRYRSLAFWVGTRHSSIELGAYNFGRESWSSTKLTGFGVRSDRGSSSICWSDVEDFHLTGQWISRILTPHISFGASIVVSNHISRVHPRCFTN